jgi:hypothetical protein
MLVAVDQEVVTQMAYFELDLDWGIHSVAAYEVNCNSCPAD